MTSKTTLYAGVNSPTARAYDKADHTNAAGHPSFTRDIKERVAQMLLTGTLSNTFYATAEKLAKDQHDLLLEAAQKEPEYLAKAIVHARNVGCMRLMPIVGLVHLSNLEKEHRVHFRAAFPLVIRTPHDLQSFIEWATTSGIRPGNGLGSGVKKVIGTWLNNLSEYHAIKYPLVGKGKEYAMRDILRVVRVKPKNEAQSALFEWMVDGKLPEGSIALEANGGIVVKEGLLKQVPYYEALKQATKPHQFQALIRDGRIPHEVATGVVKPDAATWSFIMRQMPHFALLRNLVTLNRNGVFKVEDNVQWAVAKLTEERAIRNSKVLPFRYFEAHRMATEQGVEPRICDALVVALEASFVNMPEIPGNVIVGVDVSGSMQSCKLSDKTTVCAQDVAAIFAACLLKKSPTSQLIAFDTEPRTIKANRHDSVMTIANAIKQFRGGGTDIGIPMRVVNAAKLNVDTLVVITDNEEWHTQRLGYGRGSGGFYGEWVGRKNKAAKAFCIQVTPHPDAVAPVSDESVSFIYGWSTSVLTYIGLTLQGAGGQVAAIEAVSLAPTKAEGTDE